jgi:hypothetical protein
MLYWQAVNGGLPCGGIGSHPMPAKAEIPVPWQLLIEYSEIRIFGATGQIVALLPPAGPGTIYAGATDRSRFEHITETFGASWDYSETGDPS